MEADLGVPPSRRRVDLSRLGGAAAGGGARGAELQAQVEFLEGVVARLSGELARTQGRPSEELGGLLPGAPRPAWLTDAQVLAPLLQAYDAHLAEVAGQVERGERGVAALKGELAAVIDENARLVDELERAQTLVAARASEAGPLPRGDPHLAERLELLSSENELLASQQDSLTGEISFLHQQLETRTAEAVKLGEDLARSLADAETCRKAADAATAHAIEYESKLRGLRARLAEQEGEARKTAAQVQQLQAGERTSEGHIDDLRNQLQLVQQEAGIVRQQAAEAQGQLNDARRDLSVAKGSYASLEQERALLLAEAADLKQALAALEAKNGELEAKEAVAFQRMQEADEISSQAKASAEALAVEKDSLAQQIAKAERGFEDRVADIRRQLEDEFRNRNDAYAQALSADVGEVAKYESMLALARADAGRFHQEKMQAESELQSVRHMIAEGPSAEVVDLSRQVQDVEIQRDQALHRLESAENEHTRRVRELERKASEAADNGASALETAGRLAAEAERLKAEVAQLRGQEAAAASGLQQAQRTRAEVENSLKQQLEAERAQHHRELAALGEQAKGLQIRLTQSTAEAETVLGTKDSLLAKYKAEAKEALKVLEQRTAAEQARTSGTLQQLQAAQEEVQRLRAEKDALAQEAGQARGAEQKLGPRLQATAKQLRDAKAQLAASIGRDAEHVHETARLQNALDRLTLDRNRLKRQYKTAVRTSQRMEQQSRSLQSALLATKPQALAA